MQVTLIPSSILGLVLCAIVAGPFVESVVLEDIPTSQVQALLAPRVPELLEFGNASFATEVEDGELRVATRAGEPRRYSVSPGDVVEFHWERGEMSLTRSLRFDRELDRTWRYATTEATLLDLGAVSVRLVDVNLDGSIDFVRDGFGAAGGGPLLPLAPELLIADQRITLTRSDEGVMSGESTSVRGSPIQLAALARINELRLDQGLPGLALIPELSRGCSHHAEYLIANDWDGESDATRQRPGAPKTTREGRLAARVSHILPLSPERALEVLFLAPATRPLLSDPDLEAIGISGTAGDIAVIDLASRGTHRELPSRQWTPEILIPAPASRRFSTNYPVEAGPEPVKNARRMGPPLTIALRDLGADVQGYEAELYQLGGKIPRKLPVVILPLREKAPNVFGVLPKRALKADARYEVIHRMSVDGEPRVVRARFETR